MADAEQLKRLQESIAAHNGCQAWNQWRIWHPFKRINLTGIRLEGADLKGADLKSANLSGARLGDALLTNANLTSADLRGADFEGLFIVPDRFLGTNVANAVVDRQTFAGIDTHGLLGLASVRYVESTPVSAVGDVFISYSRRDVPFVDRLDAGLHAAGMTTWVDRGQLEGGQQWLRQIQKAIDGCVMMLVVLSPEAVQSEYVESEYHYAYQKHKIVIPLDYRTCEVPMLLSRLQMVDFRTVPYEQGLAQLLKALQSYIH